MVEKQDCPICCESINKSTRKLITCPHCSADTCITCVKRYLLDLYGDPNCMHCNVGWNNDFMRQTFPSSWISKDYKEHREKVLFDIEKARMPETQQYITITVEKSKQHQKMNELASKVKQLRDAYQRAQNVYREQQYLVTRYDRFLAGQGPNPLDPTATLTQGTASSSTTMEHIEKKQFVMPCPMDGCRGFLSTGWKCGVCSASICKDCHCRKDDDEEKKAKDVSSASSNNDEDGKKVHICDPAIKASVALMKRDSKNCPSCGSMIFRIEGCDQMWCTQCCNAFSWNTGRVQKGMVHNPHYFEWLRSQGGDTTRAMRDIVNCGARFIDRYVRFTNRDDKIITDAYRLLAHIDQVEKPKFRVRQARTQDENRDIRISYMIGIMSEKEFKMLLQKKEKERSKKTQIYGLLDMFIDVVDELIRQSYENKDVNRDYIAEMHQFRRYTNRCFRSVAKQYQSQTAGFLPPEFNTILWTKTNGDYYKKVMEKDDAVDNIVDGGVEKVENPPVGKGKEPAVVKKVDVLEY